MSPKSFEKRGDLFIEKMRDAGVIDQALFSMMIELKNETSKITFGGYDLEAYAYPNETVRFHNITSDSSHWMLNLEKMTLTNTDDPIDDTKYEFGKNKSIIVDSGTSFLLMPKKDRQQFLNFIQMDKNFLCFEGGIAVCYCLGENYLDYFPDLVFHIDGH